MMNSKEILQLKAENMAMKTMLENIRNTVGEVNSSTETGSLFFYIGKIKYFCSEQDFKLWTNHILSQLEQEERNAETDENKQESSGT